MRITKSAIGFLGHRAVDKKCEVDIGDKARNIKDKFEKGEVYCKDEARDDSHYNEDSAVFEQGKFVHWNITKIASSLLYDYKNCYSQGSERSPDHYSWKWMPKRLHHRR